MTIHTVSAQGKSSKYARIDMMVDYADSNITIGMNMDDGASSRLSMSPGEAVMLISKLSQGLTNIFK